MVSFCVEETGLHDSVTSLHPLCADFSLRHSSKNIRRLLVELQSIGYTVRCVNGNSMSAGFPQRRRRLYFIGILTGYDTPAVNFLVDIADMWGNFICNTAELGQFLLTAAEAEVINSESVRDPATRTLVSEFKKDLERKEKAKAQAKAGARAKAEKAKKVRNKFMQEHKVAMKAAGYYYPPADDPEFGVFHNKAWAFVF